MPCFIQVTEHGIKMIYLVWSKGTARLKVKCGLISELCFRLQVCLGTVQLVCKFIMPA